MRFSNINERNLQETDGKLSLRPAPNINFGSFFEELNKKDSKMGWAEILNYVLRFKTEEGIAIPHIPLMRPRNRDKFFPIQSKEVLYLTDVKIGKTTIADKQAVLVTASNYPNSELTFLQEGTRPFPGIISLNPLFRSHYIETINAPDWNLLDVLYNDGFLGALPELEEQTIFLIKNLWVKSKDIRIPENKWFPLFKRFQMLEAEILELEPKDAAKLKKDLANAEEEPIILNNVIIIKNPKDALTKRIVKSKKFELFPEGNGHALFFIHGGKKYFLLFPFQSLATPRELDAEEARNYEEFFDEQRREQIKKAS